MNTRSLIHVEYGTVLIVVRKMLIAIINKVRTSGMGDDNSLTFQVLDSATVCA